MTALSYIGQQSYAGATATLFLMDASALPTGLTQARPRVRDKGATFVTFRGRTR